MEAAGLYLGSGVLLSRQSRPVSHCGLCGCPMMNCSSSSSPLLGPREAAASLASMSAAEFSGRAPNLVSRLERSGGSRLRNSALYENFGGRVRNECRQSPSTSGKYDFILGWAVSAARATGKDARSSGTSFHRSASGGQALDGRSNCVGNLSHSSFGNRQSFALIGHGDTRARRAVRVSTSPAAETDSKRIYYASEVSVAGGEEQHLTEELPPDLERELMPRHVAIIMDGNARWAKGRGTHPSLGHAAGAEALKKVAKAASKWGIDALTVFAFSTENWRRPQVEVDFLMHMFETKLRTEMENIIRYNFRLRFVGDVSALPLSLQKAIESAKKITRVNTGMIINVCVSYSGRADLVQACQQLAVQVAEGTLNPADIDDAAIANKVFMSDLGELQDPDLVIRTSGEQRISNFLLWQVAYSEFVFSDTLWPDFGKEEFRAALVTYQRRHRRYGTRDA